MGNILTVTANPAIDRVYFVENFRIGQVHRPIKAVFTAGGKGLNVSRVCSLLGEKVTATGFLGGYNGAFIRSEVKKLGITDGFTQIDGETRQCINISEQNGVSSEILESGPAISPEERDSFLNSFQVYVKDADIITVSGSLPSGLDTSLYISILQLAKTYNKKVLFDVSGKTLAVMVANKPFMVKPNKDEFMKLTGWPAFEPEKALLFLREQGVEIPFISLGKEGAVALIDEKVYSFSVPTVNAVNTVGSGDSTVAGIATGISRGLPLWDAIRLGMAAGVANTMFEQTGVVSKELVADFYKQITVDAG